MPAVVCARGRKGVPEEVVCGVYVCSKNRLSRWCWRPGDVEARWGGCGEGSLDSRHGTNIVVDVVERDLERLVGWNIIEIWRIIY